MTSYITYDDVVVRNGEPPSQGDVVVQRWIDVAHAKLRRLEPDLDGRVTAGSIDQFMLEDVLVEAVWRRVQDDLIGWRVRSETWPENTTMFKDQERTGIYFTEDELADLGIEDVDARNARGVFSVSPKLRPRWY